MQKSLKMLQSLRLLHIVPIAAGAYLIAAGPSAAEPQELKVTEHNTTQTITTPARRGTAPETSLPSDKMRSSMPTTRTRSASTRASVTASCRARFGSASGRWPWIRAS